MEGTIAVFIPIIMLLVIGLIFVTFFYYRSREKQMLIEKGLSADDIKQFFQKQKDYFMLTKVGIICIFFGIGLGLGFLSEPDEATRGPWMSTSIFVFTGMGFVAANLIGNKLRKQFKLDD